jgi:hypothetical protein
MMTIAKMVVVVVERFNFVTVNSLGPTVSYFTFRLQGMSLFVLPDKIWYPDDTRVSAATTT